MIPASRRCACIGVDNESDVREASPGCDIGEVGNPEHVWTWCPELTIDVILRARCCLVADRRADGLAPDRSLKAHIAHQPFYSTPRHVMVLAPQLPPDLAHAINLEVVIEDPAYLRLQGGVTLGSRRSLGRISTPGDMSVIGRRGDRQDFANRLDPMGSL